MEPVAEQFLRPFSISPDGRRIVGAAYGEADTQWDVVELTLEDEPAQRPLVVAPYTQWYPEIAPSGDWLLYMSRESGHPEVARGPLVFNKDGVEERLGLYGVGQIVVVGDTGVSTGDEATVHQDLRGRVYTGTWGSGTCGTWRDDDGHGTHVAGSVLGSGVMDGAVTSTHSYAGTNAGMSHSGGATWAPA